MVAIISVLIAVLLPSLTAARGQAQRTQCLSNQRQLGIALQMYGGDYRGMLMPLAYSDQTPQTYWWGAEVANLSGTEIDHTRGFTWPYLGADLKVAGVYECPSQPWGTYQPQAGATGVTSTYGYNGYYLCPPYTPGWSWQIGKRPWQRLETVMQPARVFAFGDTMVVVGGQLQNCALLDPPLLYQGPNKWVKNLSPTTSFRHAGQTVAALVDGHAASLGLRGGVLSSAEGALGSVGTANDPYYVPDWRSW